MTRDSYNLHSAIGYQLTLTARQAERRFEGALKTLDLTRITWCILLAAGEANRRYPSDIADFIGIDRTATSRALRQMENAGLVSRKTGQKDGRMTEVRLTEEGAERLAAATPLAREARAETEARLTTDELAELTRLLEKLRARESAPLQRL